MAGVLISNTISNAKYGVLSSLGYGIYFQFHTASYVISSIKIKLGNLGSPGGVITAGLYALAGGYAPSGPLITYGQRNVAEITGWPYDGGFFPLPPTAGEFIEFTFDTPTLITSIAEGGHGWIINFTSTGSITYPNYTGRLMGAVGGIYTAVGLAGHNYEYAPGSWVSLNSLGSPLFELYGDPYVPPSPTPPAFPPTRPGGYAPDDFWIPGEWNGGTYTPPEWGQPTDGRYFATGGGRWGIQLVAVGNGKIYYEELV